MSLALEKFKSTHKNKFNLSSLFSEETKRLEEEFSGTEVYKYYGAARRGFFKMPQLRFTQKTGLNDPFELTRRWEQFGSPPTRELMMNYVRDPVMAMMNNVELLADIFCERFLEMGVTPDRKAIIDAFNGPQGQVLLSQQLEQTETMVASVMQMTLDQMSAGSDQLVDDLVRSMGIFSVSSTGTSQPMWGLYASSGAGFVVKFHARHKFFLAPKNDAPKSLLRKVHYTDQRVDDFWNDPYYLFGVKETEWSFEKELRIIRALADCTLVGHADGNDIYVQEVVPGMIDSIIFGYNYPSAHIDEDVADLRSFDPAIKFDRAVIDTSVTKIRTQPV